MPPGGVSNNNNNNIIYTTTLIICTVLYCECYEGGAISGGFGAELAKRPGSSSSKDGDSSNHYHRRGSAMEGGGGEEEDDHEEGASGGNVEELFAGSFLPPVQLPLDYSMHVKQRTLVAPTTKTIIKKIKQEPVDDLEEMDTSESNAVSASKHVRFAKPVTQSAASEIKGHRVTAAELFTPSEVHFSSNLSFALRRGVTIFALWHFRLKRGSSYSFSYLIVSPSLWQQGRVLTSQWRWRRALEPAPLSPQLVVLVVQVLSIQRYMHMHRVQCCKLTLLVSSPGFSHVYR